MATGLNFLKSYFLASDSTTSSFVAVDLRLVLNRNTHFTSPLVIA